LLKGLETLKSLKHINLSHNFLTIENTKSELLGQLFENYPLLEYLNLNNIKFSLRGFTILIYNILKCQNLECIELQSCVREPEKITSFINILPKFKKLTKINLSFNQINCETATLLATVLPKCISLEHIDLDRNIIGSIGADNIAKVLPDCTLLKYLNLGNNDIGLEGANKIIESIINYTPLIYLNLSNNNIGPRRLTDKMYLKAMKDCPLLTNLLI
jgi:Ran GTPase-activating protein (RanGAP) involved in mRNA processing and transport